MYNKRFLSGGVYMLFWLVSGRVLYNASDEKKKEKKKSGYIRRSYLSYTHTCYITFYQVL